MAIEDGDGVQIVDIGSQFTGNSRVDDISGVDWSPDGRSLLVPIKDMVRIEDAGTMLIDVSTGAQLPLSGLGRGYLQSAFVR